MPEVGLGIGRYRGLVGGVEQEILTWYDCQGDRYLSGEERAEQERLRAEQERSRAEQAEQREEQAQQRAEQEQRQREKLEAYLRSQGIDPNQLPD